MPVENVLMTPFCTIAYPKLWVAALPKKPKPNDKPKFSCALLFTAADTETPEYKAMVAAVLTAIRELFGSKADAMIREEAIKLPFNKDIATKGYPESFARYINVSSSAENPPAVVGRDGKPLTDKREIYPGAIVRVSLGAYAFGEPGSGYSPGAALGMRNVQKVADAPRIDGRSNSADEFGALPPATGGTTGAATGSAGDLASLMG